MAAAIEQLWIDPRLLQRLKGIELRSRQLVRGLYANRHRTKDFGASTEFVEHRSYRRGDEVRDIDWRVFARTKRFFVKRHLMESNMRVHFVLDTSDSMRVTAPADLPTKLDLACMIAGAISMMAVTQQDSAGLCCFGDRMEERIPAKQGLRHLSLLYQHLVNPPGSGGGNFGELLQESLLTLGTRGLIFVITDALDDLPPLFDGLKMLRAQDNDVALFQVLDRNELLFPYDRMTEFRHPESTARVVGDPAQMRNEYLIRLQAHLVSVTFEEKFLLCLGIVIIRDDRFFDFTGQERPDACEFLADFKRREFHIGPRFKFQSHPGFSLAGIRIEIF